MTAALALLIARGPTLLADLPFEHAPGRILLKASLNGRPALVALDSGATLTVADVKAAEAAGATQGKAIPVSGNGATKVAGWRATGLTLIVDGTAIRAPVTVAVPLDGANQGAGRPIDAVLGCDFLKRFVVEIDYVRERVRLFDPTGYTPPKGYRPSPLRLDHGRPLVEGALRVAGVQMNHLSILVDSSVSGGIDLEESLVRRSGLEEHVVSDAAEGSAGLGGSAQSRVVLGVTGHVGSVGFSGGVRMVLTPGGSPSGFDARVGDEFLGHCDVVLDLSRETIYFRPNGR